jgi:hypothetical protein
MSQPSTARYTWRRPREIATNYVFALLFSFVAYMVAGAPFIYWGAKTTAYYVGHTTEATVVATNVEGFVGVPDDDASPESGSTGSFTDDAGHAHAIFLRQATTIGQRVSISYLPCLPGLAVERADYEQGFAVYIFLAALSAVLLYLFWHFILQHLVALRDKVDPTKQAQADKR